MSDNPRPRDRARTYDVVVFGATGFTGKLVAEYLVEHYAESDLRLAIAGRSERKLEEVRRDLAKVHASAADLPILVADSFDRDALSKLACATEVVASTVGPFAKYGERLVAVCAENGTDYCDLTGETHFIRKMIDRYHATAKETGARIVHCCGFDSIPSDLGTLMMQDAMKERHGVAAREVKFILGESKGAASGGTIASMLNIVDEAKKDRNILKILGNPYALNPEGEQRGPDGSDQRGVRYDDDARTWTGPFMMAAINTRVVRRSNALLGYPWGRDFRYSESQAFGDGPSGAAKAAAVAGGVVGFLSATALGPTRRLLEKRLPKPGEGPSKRARERGYFKVLLFAKGHGSERPVTLRGMVVGERDPGYGETAKMLGESALCLALDGAQLDSEGGVLTPASAMGSRLIERLRDAGMTFKVT